MMFRNTILLEFKVAVFIGKSDARIGCPILFHSAHEPINIGVCLPFHFGYIAWFDVPIVVPKFRSFHFGCSRAKAKPNRNSNSVIKKIMLNFKFYRQKNLEFQAYEPILSTYWTKPHFLLLKLLAHSKNKNKK